MNDEEKQEDGVKALVEALALVDEGLAVRINGAFVATTEWAEDASKIINHAAAIIIECERADRLQREMVSVLEGLHSRMVDDRNAWRKKYESDEWRTKYESQVERARALALRVENVESHSTEIERELDEMTTALAACRDAVFKHTKHEGPYFGDAIADPKGVPFYVRDALGLQHPQPKCECNWRTRMVGDGCAVCNPRLAAELKGE